MFIFAPNPPYSLGIFSKERIVADFQEKLSLWANNMDEWIKQQQEEIVLWNKNIDDTFKDLGDNREYLKLDFPGAEKLRVEKHLLELLKGNISSETRRNTSDLIATLLNEITNSFVKQFNRTYGICNNFLNANMEPTYPINTNIRKLKVLENKLKELIDISLLQEEIKDLPFEVAISLLKHENTLERYRAAVINYVMEQVFSTDSDEE